MGAKNVWLNPPLERLQSKLDTEKKGKKAGRGGGFSAKLGDIVGRYELIMAMTPAIELTNEEKMILSEVICGSALSSGEEYGTPAMTALKYMHDSVLDCATGTESERKELSDKIAKLSPTERMAIVEALGL